MDEANNQNYQNQKNCGCGNKWCGCSKWHGGHHMGFHILRWLLGIFVILFVFWFGMKVGELKGQIESGRGWSGMRHHSMMIEYGGYGMMSPGTVQSAPASK